MNRVMIAGTKSGVGKTTLSMGIMAALSRNMSVQPFKVGPDYIDPAFHTYITGNICRNLDSYLLTKDIIKYLFIKNSKHRDIAIIEGVMGLFDGAEIESDRGSSASIAKILQTPVILVIDGSKVASSIAATVKGFELFDNDLNISGVIINNVGSKKHYELIKKAIEYHTDVTPCGYLLKNSKLNLPERHLGLVPACEIDNLDEVFSNLADEVIKSIDIEKILEISKVPSVNSSIIFGEDREIDSSPINIAIAKDRAFNFYYQDSLDLLSDLYGVNWIPYSPLDDKRLPDNIHGLYIGGGFPEVFTKEILNNSSMREDLIEKLNSGLPYIAECGGLIYLTESIKGLDGVVHPMTGWLSGQSEMTTRLQNFGYGKLTLKDRCILGKSGDEINIHEFHRSKVNLREKRVFEIEKVRDGKKVSSWQCGYIKGNGVAGYSHFHFLSNINFAYGFIKSCVEFKRRGN